MIIQMQHALTPQFCMETRHTEELQKPEITGQADCEGAEDHNSTA